MSEWGWLKQLAEAATGDAALPPGAFTAIASRLEELVAEGTRDDLISTHAELETVLRQMISASDPAVATALRGGAGHDPRLARLYSLGQLGFAHHLAGQVGSRRAGDKFIETMVENAALVGAMARRESTGVELAKAIDSRPETISRKLQVLREHGISDFHRDGTSFVNFLTPAAQEYVTAHPEKFAVRGSAVARRVDARRKDLPKYLQSSMTFSIRRPTEERCAGQGR